MTTVSSTQPHHKGRLIGHFENRASKAQNNSGWSELWESNESALWDRGVPSPALIDLIEQHSRHLLPNPATTDATSNRRLKALVPGCGRGYDVVALALHGFDAYGLEVSQNAVDAAQSYARSELAHPHDYNFSERGTRPNNSRGEARILIGDFFERGWEETCFVDGQTGFDLIYDYTFLCAIIPTLRLDWARRMKQLLSLSGILVCLEFPLYKDIDAPGPPYGVKGLYWNLLAEGEDGVVVGKDQSRESPALESSSTRKEECLERVLHYHPDRTYEIGTGTDMLSVWKHTRHNE